MVQREAHIFDLNYCKTYEKEVQQSMLEELQRWLGLGAIERMAKHRASNVIDAPWVFKWKHVDDKWRIQARFVVRGSKDLQASQLSTLAGATSLWGQRLINSVAVQMGWLLFSADLSQAILRGLTFDEAAKRDRDLVRDVQFTAPPSSAPALQQLPGFKDFNPFTEVLNMLRCGSFSKTHHASGSMCWQSYWSR
ncbi:hypothetical protein N9L68_06495 [bacterium]|nr:hypothetical protein [bacterium]